MTKRKITKQEQEVLKRAVRYCLIEIEIDSQGDNTREIDSYRNR